MVYWIYAKKNCGDLIMADETFVSHRKKSVMFQQSFLVQTYLIILDISNHSHNRS